MFNPVLQGNVIIDNSLQVFYDFGDSESYIPNFGTTVFDLSPNNTNGTLVGGPVYRNDFGGCLQYDGIDDNVTYSGFLGTSFSTTVAFLQTRSTATSIRWVNDDGAFPGYRPTNASGGNGFVNATAQTSGLVAVLQSGTSFSTLVGSDMYPVTLQNDGYGTFANVTTFTTNGVNLHKGYVNNFLVYTNTASKIRGNSVTGTIHIGRDPFGSSRFPIGRVIAYMHYNRELSDNQVYQNHNYFLNRFLTKTRNSDI